MPSASTIGVSRDVLDSSGYECDRCGASFAAWSILRRTAPDRHPVGASDLRALDPGIRSGRQTEAQRLKIPESTVDAVIRAFCFTGREVDIYFSLRPVLPDPGDEFLLDLAVAGRADAIVTHNARHFPHIGRFGIRVMTPGEFLRTMKGEGI